MINTWLGLVEAFDGTLASAERLVVIVNIRGQQISGFCIGTRNQNGRRAHDICGQTCSIQLLNRFTCRDQYLATHVAALLHRRELIFEVNAGSACFDHGLHQFKCVQYTTKACFGVGDDRRKEIDVIFAFRPLNLIGAGQRVVNTLDDHWYRVGWVQRLIRVHLARQVGVTRHLPAREVNRFQACFHLLHRLVAGQCAQRIDERLGVHEVPKLLGAAFGERVLNHH